jgi:hypothetical protein
MQPRKAAFDAHRTWEPRLVPPILVRAIVQREYCANHPDYGALLEKLHGKTKAQKLQIMYEDYQALKQRKAAALKKKPLHKTI